MGPEETKLLRRIEAFTDRYGVSRDRFCLAAGISCTFFTDLANDVSPTLRTVGIINSFMKAEKLHRREAICTVADCGRPQHGLGLCSFHWNRQRHGRPLDAPFGISRASSALAIPVTNDDVKKAAQDMRISSRPLGPVETAYLEAISAYTKRRGISDSKFGADVLHDNSFLAKWRTGHRSPTLATVDRVMDYIEANPAPDQIPGATLTITRGLIRAA